jgi:hypothetical protein
MASIIAGAADHVMTEPDIENPADHILHAKHARHAAQSGDRLTRDVAIAVSFMAIIAATIGSLQETESALALGLKNEAVLLQAQASDQWNFFQAKSIKKNSYQIAAEEATAQGRDAAAMLAKAKRYADEEADLQTKASDLELTSRTRWGDSTQHTHRQHTLTFAATLVHVGIAISSLAIFTGRRLALNAALTLTAVGGAVSVIAFVA